MDEAGRAAFIISQAACAIIDAAGMTAENKQREHNGQSMAYVDADFFRLIDKYGIHHNAVVSFIRGN